MNHNRSGSWHKYCQASRRILRIIAEKHKCGACVAMTGNRERLCQHQVVLVNTDDAVTIGSCDAHYDRVYSSIIELNI